MQIIHVLDELNPPKPNAWDDLYLTMSVNQGRLRRAIPKAT